MTDPIIELYRVYEESIINDIARRLAKNMGEPTETAAWQMQRLIESGKVYDHALTELSALTGQSQQVLRELFQQAGVRAMRFDDAIYKAAGLNPLPLNLSPAMILVLKEGLRKTNGIMHNLTLTTAISGQEAFVNAADLAYMQVTSGAFSYQQAIRQAVKQVAHDGLRVVEFARRTDQLDVSMRRAVLTGVAQTTSQMQIARMDELGVDLVQTSAHMGARNKGEGPQNHESWQGRVFSRLGNHSQYPDFVKTTGYGTGEGLSGWNCRHSFYGFFPGISENAYKEAILNDFSDKIVTYNEQEMSFYDATQLQRGFERQVRYFKRQANALDAAGLDNSVEVMKIKNYQARLRDFVRQTGLKRQPIREVI